MSEQAKEKTVEFPIHTFFNAEADCLEMRVAEMPVGMRVLDICEFGSKYLHVIFDAVKAPPEEQKKLRAFSCASAFHGVENAECVFRFARPPIASSFYMYAMAAKIALRAAKEKGVATHVGEAKTATALQELDYDIAVGLTQTLARALKEGTAEAPLPKAKP